MHKAPLREDNAQELNDQDKEVIQVLNDLDKEVTQVLNDQDKEDTQERKEMDNKVVTDKEGQDRDSETKEGSLTNNNSRTITMMALSMMETILPFPVNPM